MKQSKLCGLGRFNRISIIITVLCTFIPVLVHAQDSLKLKFVDLNNVAIKDANVVIQAVSNQQFITYGFTNKDGELAFSEKCLGEDTCYTLVTTHISYKKQIDTLCCLKLTSNSIVSIILQRGTYTIKPVKIKATQFENKDTVTFQAMDFLEVETVKVQELLANMPGFEINENGQIFFRGKEVTKIFIDGDDLAGNNYQVLSKNVNANLINEVQVLKKYHRNKYLKSLLQSDDVAINLSLKDSLKLSVSGSVAIEESFKKRRGYDVSALSLTKKFKLLVLGSFNNIGTRYFDNQGVDKSDNNRSNQYNLNINYPLSPQNIINVPYLENKYVNNNQLLGTGMFTSFSIKKHTKARIGVSAQNASFTAKNSLSSINTIDNTLMWSLSQSNKNSNTLKQYVMDVSTETDINNYLTQLDLTLDLSSLSNTIENQSTGFYSDDFNSILSTKPKPILTGQLVITKALKNKSALVLKNYLNKQLYQQELTISSTRLNEFLQIDDSLNTPNSIRQDLKGERTDYESKLSYFKRVSTNLMWSLDVTTGVSNFEHTGLYQWPTMAFNNLNVNYPRQVGSSGNMLNNEFGGTISYQLKNTLLTLNGKAGVQQGKLNVTDTSYFKMPIYENSLKISSNIKKAIMTVIIGVNKSTSYSQEAYAPYIISQDIALSQGITRVQTLAHNYLSWMIANNNLFRLFRYSVLFNFSNKPKVLIYESVVRPAYTASEKSIGQGKSIKLNSKLMYKILPINTLLELKPSFFYNENEVIINGLKRDSKSEQFNVSIRGYIAINKKIDVLLGLENTESIYRQQFDDNVNNPTINRFSVRRYIYGIDYALKKLKSKVQIRYKVLVGNVGFEKFNALDFQLKTMVTSRFHTEINIHNLLNSQEFKFTRASGSYEEIEIYNTVPFFGTVGLSYTF